MKHLLLAACLITLPAQQAVALSCLRPTIESAFMTHSEAAETYILVLGELVNKRNVIPGRGETETEIAGGESYVATFTGYQSTRSGFDKPIEVPVAVKGTCLASWCGGVNADVEMITFLEKTPFGYTLKEGPCGGTVFYNPDKDMKRRALRCLRGGICIPKNR